MFFLQSPPLPIQGRHLVQPLSRFQGHTQQSGLVCHVSCFKLYDLALNKNKKETKCNNNVQLLR